jgi:iron complex outermembrane recepter protein
MIARQNTVVVLIMKSTASAGSRLTTLMFTLCVSTCGAAATRADETEEASALDEVVVTATRRETKLLQTPMSMTVIGADTLRAIDADDVDDFARLVPGLTAKDSGPGYKRYALRGLQSAGEPEVGLYYDEIPLSGLPGPSLDTGDRQPDIKLWDVDRIEVLRGPQGTLYGDGSMGGTVRIISKRPVLDGFHAAMEVGGAATADGGNRSLRWSGMVNIPVVSDVLAVRLAGYDRNEGGWIDDIYRPAVALRQIAGDASNWEHTAGGRASVLFKPTDDLTVTGIAYYQSLTVGSAFDTYPAFALPHDRYVSAAFVRTPWTDRLQMYNLIINDHLKWGDFVITGSYEDRTVDDAQDTTRYLLSLFHCTEFTWEVSCFGPSVIPAASYEHERVDATSAEARLVSRQEGPLQWTVGAFVQSAATYRRGQVAEVSPTGYVVFDPNNGNAVNRIFGRNNHDSFDKFALFEEGAYEILQDLKASIGLRWFHSYRSDEQVIVQQFFPGQPTGAEPFQKFSARALYKRFGLSYSVAPNALVYVEAAQGFRSGGPNYPGGFTTTAPPYQGDSLWDYEFGWKLTLPERRLVWTGAIFRIDWSHLQQLVPTSLFNYIVNAGSARSDGFETEIEVPLFKGLRLSGGTSFTNAHLIGGQPVSSDPNTQLYEGERLAGVPRWTVNAALTYARPLWAGLQATGRLDYTYQSSRSDIVAVQNPGYFVTPGSTLAALHLGVGHNDAWSVQLGVDNLFNSFVPLSAETLDSNLVKSVTAARPRTIRITVTGSF